NGPPAVLADTEVGMDGTTKHFFQNGSERDCDYIEDRHGNRTVLTYGQSAGDHNLLTRVTDPSGRYLQISWTNVGTTQSPIWRITQVQGPFDPSTGLAVYTVTYEYGADYNLWKVHQDPAGLNRVVTYGYTTVSGEAGLLASISDPLNHTVSYQYTLRSLLNALCVRQVTEPGSRSSHVITISHGPGSPQHPVAATASSNGGWSLAMGVDSYLRMGFMQVSGSPWLYYTQYDSANNVTSQTILGGQAPMIDSGGGTYEGLPNTTQTMTYGPHGNVLTASTSGVNGQTTYSYFNASKYFQKQSVTDNLGRTTSFEYLDKFDSNPGNRGEVYWVRDARDGTTGRHFSYSYNQYGQKLSEINLNNVETDYVYGDAWGNLTQVVQDPGTGHLNRSTSMSYDVAGRIVSSTDPKGQSASFTFNNVGQPLTASFVGETITYGYGSNGRTESVQDNRGTTSIAYEPGNDRVASVTDPVTGAVGYTYSVDGRRLTMSLPGGGTWNYSYYGNYSMLPKDDPNSCTSTLKRITDDQNRVVDYSISSDGRLVEVWSDQSFDGGGSLQSYQKTRSTYCSYPTYGSGAWLSEIKNSWKWLQNPGGWQERTLVQNDYTYSDVGN